VVVPLSGRRFPRLDDPVRECTTLRVMLSRATIGAQEFRPNLRGLATHLASTGSEWHLLRASA